MPPWYSGRYERRGHAQMPSRESEAFVLRTYPYREADLIVSFVTRDQGKLRGTARGARRPKSRFGSGLERLAHARIFYFQRQNRELVSLDRCELIGPPLFLRADYPTSLVLDYVAEVCDQLLPEHEPNDAFFRLLRLVAAEMWSGMNEASWPSATGRAGEPELVAVASGEGNTAAREGTIPAAGTPRQGNRMRDGEGPGTPGPALARGDLLFVVGCPFGGLAAASPCLYSERRRAESGRNSVLREVSARPFLGGI